MHRENLTKSFITSITCGVESKVIYDSEVDGLLLRVGKRTKTFYVRRKMRGRYVIVKIGDANFINPVLARKKAQEILGQISTGIDPRKPIKTSITLMEAFKDFKEHRELRPGTVKSYNVALHTALKELLNEPIQLIDGDRVLEIHQRMGRSGQKQYANAVMRVLRSVLNFAKGRYRDAAGRPLLMENPVARLSETRSWYKATRRKTIITRDQLPIWIDCLNKMENRQAADYYLLLLLTGLRKEEATTLEWSNVDMTRGLFTITEKIAKNETAHTLPMTARVRQIFEARLAARLNAYVFPGIDDSHVTNVMRHRNRISKETGIKFSPHDLRRTFATVAESLDLSGYLLKRLLNHRGDDVTAGYITWNPQRLLVPLQRIECRMLGLESVDPDYAEAAKSPMPLSAG